MNLPNEPLLKSQSLQMLDLRMCKMTNLPRRAFEEMPNLRSIDLSGNLLIVLNMGPFVPTEKLKLLNIEGNPIRCDAHFELTLSMMRRNRIKVFFRNCREYCSKYDSYDCVGDYGQNVRYFAARPQATSSAIFERMIALPTTPAGSTKKPDVTLDAKPFELTKVWKTDRNETCPVNDTKRVCAMYNQCMANQLSKQVGQTPTQEKEIEFDLQSRHSWMQFVNLNIAFYAGLGIGTVFGMLIVCLMSVIVSKYFTPSKNLVNESGERRNRRTRGKKSPTFLSLPRSRNVNPTLDIPQEIEMQSSERKLIVLQSKCAVNQPQRRIIMHNIHDVQPIHFSHCFSSVQCAIDISIS